MTFSKASLIERDLTPTVSGGGLDDRSASGRGEPFCFTGQEREMAEFEKRLRAADLAIVRTSTPHHPYHLIEAQAC
jgi:hypothetical protein